MRRFCVLVAVIALAAPGTASAHLRTSRAAVDYRATVSPLRAPLAGAVSVRVYRADLALGLAALGRHRIVVPSGVTSRRWAVPLLIDGRRSNLEGTIQRVGAPSAWPWLVLGAVFAVATGVPLARRPRRLLRAATAALGGLAAAATLTSAVGFGVASTASTGTWIEGANEAVFAFVGAAFLVRGSLDAKALAGGLLGLLGLAVGLTKLPVLLHGIMLSALPGEVARLAVVLAIGAGAAAAILGVVVFFDVLEHYEEPDLPERYL